jgi:hypothetical protein
MKEKLTSHKESSAANNISFNSCRNSFPVTKTAQPPTISATTVAGTASQSRGQLSCQQYQPEQLQKQLPSHKDSSVANNISYTSC